MRYDYCVAVTQDDIPKLADWLAEYRSRPKPTQVVVATYHCVTPIPDTPDNAGDAGRVALDTSATTDGPDRKTRLTT